MFMFFSLKIDCCYCPLKTKALLLKWKYTPIGFLNWEKICSLWVSKYLVALVFCLISNLECVFLSEAAASPQAMAEGECGFCWAMAQRSTLSTLPGSLSSHRPCPKELIMDISTQLSRTLSLPWRCITRKNYPNNIFGQLGSWSKGLSLHAL